MKIAVIGAGAMGSIYGGHLSLTNEVYLIDKNEKVVEHVAKEGLLLQEGTPEKDVLYKPHALLSSDGIGQVDLVILFVKSLFSKSALEGNKGIIGPNTYLMTLQNGAGHEDILGEFAPKNRIIIGTTEDNGAVLGLGHIRHGGKGITNVGMLVEDKDGFLPKLKAAFEGACDDSHKGFTVRIYDNILKLIWHKLFTNVSLSAVTGILQVDMGYIASNPNASAMAKALIHEAVSVASAMGLEPDEETIVKEVMATSSGSPKGCTSIRADLRDGRKTEVDTISGAVVRAAKKVGVSVPCHEFVVNMVHAMEAREK